MRRGIAPLADLRSFSLCCCCFAAIAACDTDFSTPKADCWASGGLGGAGGRIGVYAAGAEAGVVERDEAEGAAVAERLSAKCAHVVLCNSESLRAGQHCIWGSLRKRAADAGDGSSNGVDYGRFSRLVSPEAAVH